MSGDLWTAHGPPGEKSRRRYWRHPSGVTVRHCGHPTALRPYYLENPSGDWIGQGSETTRKGRPTGLVFRKLEHAKAWADARLAPTVELDENGELVRGWALVIAPGELPA